MAGHAQLKFVMTECSKTQIRLTRPKWRSEFPFNPLQPLHKRLFSILNKILTNARKTVIDSFNFYKADDFPVKKHHIR